jgi:hypothetical protein
VTGRSFLPDGHEYVTAEDITERWPDVNAGLLRKWVQAGWLAKVGMVRGRSLYRWADVVQAERRARLSGRGRPRLTQT